MSSKLIQSVKDIFGISEKIVLTEDFSECLKLLNDSDVNLFITGKAGTGKSTLIQYFRNHTTQKVVVVAPTGIAAINVRGQTIHSYFKFPPKMINLNSIKRVNNSNLYSDVDVIIIDEVSMLRADMLDAIDKFLRINGRDKNLPFGGIRIVMVGDLYQLPPVVTFEEMEIYNRMYETPYFFSADCFNLKDFKIIELKNIFRQKEQEFINVLNNIRQNTISIAELDKLNKNVKPFDSLGDHIILCTTNSAADSINQQNLTQINSEYFTSTAEIEGNFPIENKTLPVEVELKLKVKARVLFIKNDPGGAWVNGSMGWVHKISDEGIEVKLDNSCLVTVNKMEWENIKYSYNQKTREVEEEVIGRLKQYPLKLGWAITIHKSQGMSFDKVCIDFSKSPFAHGQTYVALSRARTLTGIVLTKKIYPNDIIVDDRIVKFYNSIHE